MKKLFMLIISITSFMIFTNNVYAYETYNFGDYGIKIENITLEYYTHDNFLYEDDETEELKMFNQVYKTVELNSKTINPTHEEDTWYLGRNLPVKLIDLNVNMNDLESLIMEYFPEEKVYMYIGVFVEYKYVQVPGETESIFPINFFEKIVNEMYDLEESSYEISNVNLGEKIKVPIMMAEYYYGDIEIYDSVEDYEEAMTGALLLNYDFLSLENSAIYNDSYDGELIYIHNLPDVERLATLLDELHKPQLYIGERDTNRIGLDLTYINNYEEECQLYRSTSRYGRYELVATTSCTGSYVDLNLESNTTYYYYLKDSGGVESEILQVKTLEEYTEPVYEHEEETTTQPTTTQKKDSGTVDNKDTGIHSFIIIGVAAIVVAVIILKFNKNSMKTKL